MDAKNIERLLKKVKAGKIGINEAMNELRFLPFEDLGFAKIDTHRALRKGFPEVILCPGKSIKQIEKIADNLVKRGSDCVATRANEEIYRAIKKKHPDCKYYKEGRIISIQKKKPRVKGGVVLVVTAGTADIPVAEEAIATLKIMGNRVKKIYDIGVAGLQRLLAQKERLLKARVIIVIAGMEGALASVIAGLVSAPVIAVPTSVGYGANFKGLSALLTMLNTCSFGVAVVNIDNGFGAGYLASIIIGKR
ncbi:MAG TPA: nickel pincer cofactor biosynthesis protein LarB [bacterium]|nr:nickel pincer cofactor biosynthesis protein LarB [bacterium]